MSHIILLFVWSVYSYVPTGVGNISLIFETSIFHAKLFTRILNLFTDNKSYNINCLKNKNQTDYF